MQKEAIWPSSLHRQQSHPDPIPAAPRLYPANLPDTKGQFTMANPPNLHIFGLWEETGAPRGNPRRHGRICKLHTDSDPRQESNPGPWSCEAAVLTTVPPFLSCLSGQDALEHFTANEVHLMWSHYCNRGNTHRHGENVQIPHRQ